MGAVWEQMQSSSPIGSNSSDWYRFQMLEGFFDSFVYLESENDDARLLLLGHFGFDDGMRRGPRRREDRSIVRMSLHVDRHLRCLSSNDINHAIIQISLVMQMIMFLPPQPNELMCSGNKQ